MADFEYLYATKIEAIQWYFGITKQDAIRYYNNNNKTDKQFINDITELYYKTFYQQYSPFR